MSFQVPPPPPYTRTQSSWASLLPFFVTVTVLGLVGYFAWTEFGQDAWEDYRTQVAADQAAKEKAAKEEAVAARVQEHQDEELALRKREAADRHEIAKRQQAEEERQHKQKEAERAEEKQRELAKQDRLEKMQAEERKMQAEERKQEEARQAAAAGQRLLEAEAEAQRMAERLEAARKERQIEQDRETILAHLHNKVMPNARFLELDFSEPISAVGTATSHDSAEPGQLYRVCGKRASAGFTNVHEKDKAFSYFALVTNGRVIRLQEAQTLDELTICTVPEGTLVVSGSRYVPPPRSSRTRR